MTTNGLDSYSIINDLSHPVISSQEKSLLTGLPSFEEITNMVMPLNPSKASGPDYLNEQFFKSSCDIISSDVVRLIQALFTDNLDL